MNLTEDHGGTVVLYAQWLPQQYTITWNNWDNWTLQREKVNYGTLPVYTGDIPTRAEDGENVYTFSNWEPQVAVVTGDAVYTASFTSTAITPAPSATPTIAPTATPTAVPTEAPTVTPTTTPTMVPTVVPTEALTVIPTAVPSATPATTSAIETQKYYSYGNGIWKYILFSGEKLVFTVKRAQADENTYSLFLRILIDSLVVDKNNYTVLPGSVIISLRPSYLDTLSIGEHILTIIVIVQSRQDKAV